MFLTNTLSGRVQPACFVQADLARPEQAPVWAASERPSRWAAPEPARTGGPHGVGLLLRPTSQPAQPCLVDVLPDGC